MMTPAHAGRIHPGAAADGESVAAPAFGNDRDSNPYLSQVERGLHEPSIRVLKSIADALNVSAEILFEQAGLISGTRSSATKPPSRRSGQTSDSPTPSATRCSGLPELRRNQPQRRDHPQETTRKEA